MCRENEADCSFITTEFNVTKLAISSTAKHLKYSMKYTDLRSGAYKTHRIYYKCSISIEFPQYVTEAVFLMIVYFFC